MKGLLRAGGVALILVALVFAGRSTSETRKPPAPRSRIALINLRYVIKNYRKYQTFQEEIKEEIEGFKKKEAELQARLNQLVNLPPDGQRAAGNVEEIEKLIARAKRDREANTAAARNTLGKKSDEQMVVLYKDVQQAVQRYARAHDLELVMHFNDADEKTDPAEFWSPANVARKMQAGALTPLYAAPGIDISEEIIAALNDGWRGK